MKKILLIKLRYLGDVVLCTPVLQRIREGFPDSHITFLVNSGTEGVLRGNANLDEIWTLPSRSWTSQFAFIRRLRKAKFNVVLDFTDGDRSAILSFASGASTRIGYNREHRWRKILYTEIVSGEYEAMHMVEYHGLALKYLGIEPGRGSNPEIPVDPLALEGGDPELVELYSQDRPFALIHPTARYVFKAWPLERFAALVDWLHKQGIRVALVGGKREVLIGQQIVNLSQSKPLNLMGRTTISQLTALMQKCSLLIGNDAGPIHMAAAVGCPVLALFGPTNPAVWGPRGSFVQFIYKEMDCRACFYPGCSRGEESCMQKISVDEVCQTARSMLQVLV